jgi:hypothetical protein
VLALGLKVKFPRYRAFDGRKSVIFNKLRQSCPGIDSFVTARLEKAIGLPAPNVRFVRMFINGAYYHYMMELDDVDEDLLSRFHGKDEPVGDLWKSNGTFGVVGPYGPGDETLLGPACGYMPTDRYRATYKRRSLDWKGPEELMSMLDKLHAARRAGLPALRAFLAETFDIDKLLSHVAMMNWAGAWDDAIHNHFLYRRPDGRWVISAWDYDQLYGGGAGIDGNTPQNAMVTFYHGQEGDPNNKLGWNVVKDSLLRAYRAEFDRRLVDMSKTLLSPQNVIALADEGEKAFSYRDWMATPARQACNVMARIETIRRWARERDAVLAARYGR